VDPFADGGADVDPAVLAGGVRVGAEVVRPQHRAVERPRPAAGGTGEREREQDAQREEPLQDVSPSSLPGV
jgi:hypothetical protein